MFRDLFTRSRPHFLSPFPSSKPSPTPSGAWPASPVSNTASTPSPASSSPTSSTTSPPNVRPGLIQAHTYLAYHRQLNNLSIQESRLNRQLVKIINDLADLQTQRQQLKQAQLTEAARHYIAANKAKKPFNHKEFGFEFSMDQIDAFAKLIEQREERLQVA